MSTEAPEREMTTTSTASGAADAARPTDPVVQPPAGPPARVRTMSWRPTVLRIAVLVVALATWEIYVRSAGSYATPGLAAIGGATVDLLTQGEVWVALWATAQALLIGYAIAAAAGVVVGLVVGRVLPLQRIANVYLSMLLSTPLAAVVPLVVIVFGIGLEARVAVVVLFSFPVIAANVITGVATVDRTLLEMGASFGCRGIRLARKIVLPAAMSETFTGLRLGAGRAVVGMVVAELIVISAGVGKLIKNFGEHFQLANTYAIVIILLVFSALFLQLVRVAERRALWWKESSSS